MRWLLIIGVLSSLGFSTALAATLRGVAISDELDGPPLAQTLVRNPGSAEAVTDELGRFALSIPHASPGDLVRLEVVRPGYAVINPTQLDVNVLADEAASALTVVLTREPIRAEMARRLYRTACVAAIRERAHLDIDLNARGERIPAESIVRDRDMALRAAGTLAVQFANVPTDAMSSAYRSALNRFLEGHIADSLRILTEPRLLEMPRTTAIGSAQFVEACLLRARILVTQFRFAEARAAYRLATTEEPGSHAAWLGLALFEQSAQRAQESKDAFQRALTLARAGGKPERLAATLVASGHLDREHERFDEARNAWQEALALFRRLADAAPEQHLPEVASTLGDLANLDLDMGRISAARSAYAEAIGIYQPLEKTHPNAYAPILAALRSNSGILASLGGKTDDARRLFEQALQSQRPLARPGTTGLQRADLARTLFNLGLLDHRLKQLPRASASYSEALALYQELAREQPMTYSADLADTLNNLGILQREERRLTEAALSLRGALTAYRTAARDQPDRFRQTIQRVEAKLRELEQANPSPTSTSAGSRNP